MMDAIFAFHVLILLLITIYVALTRGTIEKLLLGFYVFLFTVHCALWGEACTLCSLGSPVCLAEVIVFWATFIAYLVYKKMLRS